MARCRSRSSAVHSIGARPVAPFFCYSQLDLGSQVFAAGLADPRLWTNHAKMVDVGANWYLNQFVKVYFDWEHVMFGTPVTRTNGALTKQCDLFWVRAQLYF